jgi:hypothetical protein
LSFIPRISHDQPPLIFFSKPKGLAMHLRFIQSVMVGGLAFGLSSYAAAAVCSAQSSATRQPVVELYTSEGCNSCPPAERWLGLRFATEDPQAIALAFHVVYWDYLGWKDKWAKPEFTNRQKFLSARQGLRGIYTPGVFLSGREWQRWGESTSEQRDLDSFRKQTAQAVLRLDQDTKTGQVTVVAKSTALNPSGPQATSPSATGIASPTIGTATTSATLTQNNAANWDLYIATIVAPFSSKVTAGENRGETLKHAHVVRQWQGPYPLTQGPYGKGQLSLHPQDVGIIALVQDRMNGDVIQAIKTNALSKESACLGK